MAPINSLEAKLKAKHVCSATSGVPTQTNGDDINCEKKLFLELSLEHNCAGDAAKNQISKILVQALAITSPGQRSKFLRRELTRIRAGRGE